MTKPMTRKGKTLQTLRDGHPRRMSDGKNAWRKMNDAQRAAFKAWAGLDADDLLLRCSDVVEALFDDQDPWPEMTALLDDIAAHLENNR